MGETWTNTQINEQTDRQIQMYGQTGIHIKTDLWTNGQIDADVHVYIN